MSISKEDLRKAFEEILENYNPTKNDSEQITIDNLEKSAIDFSDKMINRAIEISLRDKEEVKKKPFVRSVERF